MAPQNYPRIAQLKDASALLAHGSTLGESIPCDAAVLSAAAGSPLAAPGTIGGRTVGNRWCIHPMEGWDANTDGTPSARTIDRWRHFGESGAKLIWGGEAFAVQADGRANPNQLALMGDNVDSAKRSLAALLTALRTAHIASVGSDKGLFVGLQLTHSGRFCRPNDKARLEPRIAYRHPILDRKFGIGPADDVLISDDYLDRLVDRYILAAKLAREVGFDFVDVKHCHGYLLHELLSAYTRPGKYGGSLENRARFGLTVTDRIHAEVPGLLVGIRLSAFDHPPFRPDPANGGCGVPEDYSTCLPYRYGFGCKPENPLEIDLSEPITLLKMWQKAGVATVNVSCCSPYYNPHYQRPAMFPPSDGYQPPEDPLVGVARQMRVVRQLKAAVPGLPLVGSGYTYLQDFVVQVGQAAVAQDWVDYVGVGRMVLSYWRLPADTLEGKPVARQKICRTFSDCTTAPRRGLPSGCYPLDPSYKSAPEHEQLKLVKLSIKNAK